MSTLVRLLAAAVAGLLISACGSKSSSDPASPPAPTGSPRLLLSSAANSNAAAALSVTVTAQDGLGKTIADYTGTVHFTSTDTAAVLPSDLVFTGAEGGTQITSATFNTLGTQTLTGTQATDASMTGATAVAVHGFVYTDPSGGFGSVRLVRNAAASSASLVQLDLVQANALSAAYGAGMNLPLDTSRVAAATPLLVEGAALFLGTAPRASAATLSTSGPAAGTLLVAVSQKGSGAGSRATNTAVAGGAVYYSIRLALPAAASTGTVFDGNALPAAFRAAVRDRVGNDRVSQSDFALGKLEIR